MSTAKEPVLVVDDDAGVRRAFGRLLRTLGHPAVSYDSGQAVLADPAAPHPALILLDLHLPGIRGAPLMRRLKERWPSVPIVVMTGLDRPGLAEDMIAAGAAAFLAKPISKEQLATVLSMRDRT